VPTPFGDLRLDPALAYIFLSGPADAGRRLDATIPVPNTPALVGATLALQAFGPARGELLRLGGAIEQTITP
jgi:hypothetical protein